MRRSVDIGLFSGILLANLQVFRIAERPRHLIYALDERPPGPQLLALGFQHAAAICPYLVMVALVAGEAKLPQEAARNAMALP